MALRTGREIIANMPNNAFSMMAQKDAPHLNLVVRHVNHEEGSLNSKTT